VAESILYVPGGIDKLLKAGDNLDVISAGKFIRPNLISYGKAIVTIARVYPAPGAKYKTRAKKGKSYGMRGQAGVLAKALSSRASHEYISSTAYQRTGHFRESWHFNFSGTPGITPMKEEIKNLATYSGYVMGDKQPYTWRFGWKRLKAIMLDLMDAWIPDMEHKAYNLWIRKG
jgi:hypothetical protein